MEQEGKVCIPHRLSEASSEEKDGYKMESRGMEEAYLSRPFG